MELMPTILFFIIICAVGSLFIANQRLLDEHKIIASFVIGSATIGLIDFFMAIGKMIYPTYFYPLIIAGLFITFYRIKLIWRYSSKYFSNIRNYLYDNTKHTSNKLLSLIAMIFIITFYFLLAASPPRSADAMRYQLAQLKDMVNQHYYIFRPYAHYNFSAYFMILFLPLYIFFKGVALQFVHCIYFLISLSITLYLGYRNHIKYPILLIFLFLIIPQSFHEAHEVTNDWVLICYILAAFTLISRQGGTEEVSKSRLVIASISLGFALGVKYHAVLFFPWFYFIVWRTISDKNLTKRLLYLGSYITMAFLMAAPFFVRNFINTGNPVWPLLLNIFPEKNQYLNLVAANCFVPFAGQHNFANLLYSIKELALNPLIPCTVWILAIPGWIIDKKTSLSFKIGTSSFFILWWIFQPALYPRFLIYILPFALLSICVLYEYIKDHQLKFIYYVVNLLISITIIYGIVIGIIYSKDYVKYLFNRDLTKYHYATWFYPEYEWINKNLPQDAKLLVIVSTGQTYYLDRDYIRADPGLSGLIDWRKITKVGELQDLLRSFKIDYILFEDRDWSGYLGGANMIEMINDLTQSGAAKIIWTRKANLYFSRIKSNYIVTKVTLIKLVGSQGIKEETAHWTSPLFWTILSEKIRLFWRCPLSPL